jgi:hypothetical protein
MTWQDSYHGWLIELIPSSQGYLFKCWLPDEQIGISNNYIYPSLFDAVRGARQRVKLESASLVLIQFINESYENGNLSLNEHLALTSSVFNFTASASKPEI